MGNKAEKKSRTSSPATIGDIQKMYERILTDSAVRKSLSSTISNQDLLDGLEQLMSGKILPVDKREDILKNKGKTAEQMRKAMLKVDAGIADFVQKSMAYFVGEAVCRPAYQAQKIDFYAPYLLTSFANTKSKAMKTLVMAMADLSAAKAEISKSADDLIASSVLSDRLEGKGLKKIVDDYFP
ncbi:MAG: hypothetical protein NVS9B10_17130 [Nevskia sp.]